MITHLRISTLGMWNLDCLDNFLNNSFMCATLLKDNSRDRIPDPVFLEGDLLRKFMD